MDGPDVSSLPRAPSATAPPELPAAGTAAERKQFLSAVFLDDQRLWASMFQQAGLGYRAARLVFFTSRVSTSCGAATSDVGPFYCPADHTVYLDTRFFDVMSHRFGVRGDFAEAYVVAHEVGHHVQTLLGITGRVASAQHS
jgi:predicted metalloprotease